MRKYGTCFYERYAQISLERLLGDEFSILVNKDRPDLQSPDGTSIGIEVTRAMEQSKDAASGMLKELAGISPVESDDFTDDELKKISESGYSYGLHGNKIIGYREKNYWAMALPLKHILESKVSKCINGFYGQYRKMGLYVFCREPLNEAKVLKAYRYVMSLQELQDIRYNRLYLSEIDALHVCNLDDGLSESARVVDFDISNDMRRDFYLTALRQQMDVLSGKD